MADSNNSTASDKKVKTEQTAAETIVGDASAEIKDGVESEVKVDETVDVPEEQAEAAKPQHVAKENRRGGKALREENEKLKERCKDAETKYTRLLAECENIRQRNEKESGKLYDIGAKGVLEKLLPVVLTNLNRYFQWRVMRVLFPKDSPFLWLSGTSDWPG